MKFSHDIGLVGSENILNIDGEDITWNLGESNVKVYIYKIVSVTHINDQVSFAFMSHEFLDFKDGEADQNESADDWDYNKD